MFKKRKEKEMPDYLEECKRLFKPKDLIDNLDCLGSDGCEFYMPDDFEIIKITKDLVTGDDSHDHQLDDISFIDKCIDNPRPNYTLCRKGRFAKIIPDHV